LNSWRANAGVVPITENPTWSAGDYNHAVYMVKDDQVTHYEIPGYPYYTIEGDTAARNSNIEVRGSTNFSDEQAVDWWMGAPFHALGMMDPRLTQSGFGSYREVKSGWQAGFALDTIRGNSFTGGQYPVYWPGNGTTEPLMSYSGGEFPDPLQACPGYSVPTGLPVFIQVGGNVATTAGPAHSFTGNGVSLAHCVIDSTNPAVGSNLTYRGAVIVIPQQPLVAGVHYAVSLTINGAPYSWSFTVGALAGPPGMPTAVNAVASGTSATVTWSPPADNGGSPITSYTVTPYAGSTPQTPQTVIAPTTTAVFNGLTSWVGYTFTVAATNSLGTGFAGRSNLVLAGWREIGGVITSTPDPTSFGTSRTDVFVRGSEGGVWDATWNGTAWNWTFLGGVISGSPAAVSWGPGRIDLFVRGIDNALWHRSSDGTTWAPWEKLGGVITTGPDVASWGPNRLDVFVTGSEQALWQVTWDGTAWTWNKLGGVITSDPTAVASITNRIDVFVRGTELGLWQASWNGSTWSWTFLGGILTSNPEPASCSAGHLDVFLSGTEHGLWRRGFNGSVWGPWQFQTGQWTASPGATCVPGTSTVTVFERSGDGAVWQTTVAAT
jgi:hypothetical protein